MAYSQTEIRVGVELHELRIAELRAEYDGAVGIERAHVNKFRAFCKHPARHTTSCMGETGWRCPDCHDGG